MENKKAENALKELQYEYKPTFFRQYDREKSENIPSCYVTHILREWERSADQGKIQYHIYLQRNGNFYNVKVVAFANYGTKEACLDFINKNGLEPYKLKTRTK